MSDQTIIKIDSGKSGKTVAIFGGIHGDELAGIKTIDHLKENIDLKNGILYLVYGNPKAIEKSVRYTEKNLNRCFLEQSKNASSYEETRAVELMRILDECDALLDLHAYGEPYAEAIPFAICEKNSLDIVKNFEVSKVITNIDNIEKGGTDGYMANKGKIGICVELGSIEKPEDYIGLGIKTAHQFLQSFGMIDEVYQNDSQEQTILKASDIYKKKNNNFQFTERYSTFDFIPKGKIICIDGDEDISFDRDKYILFPRDQYDVGIEAFILAEDIT
jgi:succinylglutamate desuccinylase